MKNFLHFSIKKDPHRLVLFILFQLLTFQIFYFRSGLSGIYRLQYMNSHSGFHFYSFVKY